jgi:hypothetical protein
MSKALRPEGAHIRRSGRPHLGHLAPPAQGSGAARGAKQTPGRQPRDHPRGGANVMQLDFSGGCIEQVMVSVACNGAHSLKERLARWLLMMRDRGDEDTLPITQSLAEMLGVQRPSITNAARELERAGVIERGRRQVTILDRKGLTKASCECYQLVREAFGTGKSTLLLNLIQQDLAAGPLPTAQSFERYEHANTPVRKSHERWARVPYGQHKRLWQPHRRHISQRLGLSIDDFELELGKLTWYTGYETTRAIPS